MCPRSWKSSPPPELPEYLMLPVSAMPVVIGHKWFCDKRNARTVFPSAGAVGKRRWRGRTPRRWRAQRVRTGWCLPIASIILAQDWLMG